jgi:hypothetical protein
VADAAHGGGDPSPKPASAAGVATIGAAPTMTKSATEVPSSQTQSGATTLEIGPEVDTTTVLVLPRLVTVMTSRLSRGTPSSEIPVMSPFLR